MEPLICGFLFYRLIRLISKYTRIRKKNIFIFIGKADQIDHLIPLEIDH
jgi:hypothetical protein